MRDLKMNHAYMRDHLTHICVTQKKQLRIFISSEKRYAWVTFLKKYA